jgi:hypothetical protein
MKMYECMYVYIIQVTISNVMVVLFALACDVREIYSTIRQIVPFSRYVCMYACVYIS